MPPRRAKILIPAIDPARRGGPSGDQRCRCCGRPHGEVVRCLPDGRWYDAADQTWRDHRGRRASWPDVVEYAMTEDVRVEVRALRIEGQPGAKPRLLCRRCQKTEEAVRSHLRDLMRKAVGDLFLGSYEAPGAVERFQFLRRARLD